MDRLDANEYESKYRPSVALPASSLQVDLGTSVLPNPPVPPTITRPVPPLPAHYLAQQKHGQPQSYPHQSQMLGSRSGGSAVRASEQQMPSPSNHQQQTHMHQQQQFHHGSSSNTSTPTGGSPRGQAGSHSQMEASGSSMTIESPLGMAVAAMASSLERQDSASSLSGRKRERGRPSARDSLGSSRINSPAGRFVRNESDDGVHSQLSRGMSVGAGGTDAEDRSIKRVKVGARASIACGTCRKRKVRCSGEWPTCAFCSGRNMNCVYEGHPAEYGGSGSGNGSPGPFGFANFLPMASVEPILPPVSIILEALDQFFLHNYDTFYFLHRPSLTESVQNQTAPKELMCCILAFAARFCQSLRKLHPHSSTAASEHYAALAAQVLSASNAPYNQSSSSDDDVSLVRCQCYLMLGLFECTEGAETKGWLSIGTAIRMAQVLRLGFEDEDEGSNASVSAAGHHQRAKSVDPIRSEIRRRTFWSCWLLERTITDGKERPCSLKVPLLTALRMPGNDVEFNEGRRSLGAKFDAHPPPWTISARLQAEDQLLQVPTSSGGKPQSFSDHSSVGAVEADLYGQMLRISDIWQKVATYIGSGGRNCDRRPPWQPESTFAILDGELRLYESRLPAVFRYNEANLIAHAMIGQGRLFGMLHLLFRCACLSLHRDYLPFLPPADFNAANGPADGEPLYGDSTPPEGWWQNSLSVGFEAADIISDLCVHLARHGSQITHPFAGFAALAAGTLHCHLKFWPRSSPTHVDSSRYLDQDIMILTNLKGVYPIATNWVEGIAKLQLLNHNLVRGVIDVDPNKVRQGVIKLLRTAKDDDSNSSPARSASSAGGRATSVIAFAEVSSNQPDNNVLDTQQITFGTIGESGLNGVGDNVGGQSMPLETDFNNLDLLSVGTEGFDFWANWMDFSYGFT